MHASKMEFARRPWIECREEEKYKVKKDTRALGLNSWVDRDDVDVEMTKRSKLQSLGVRFLIFLTRQAVRHLSGEVREDWKEKAS